MQAYARVVQWMHAYTCMPSIYMQFSKQPSKAVIKLTNGARGIEFRALLLFTYCTYLAVLQCHCVHTYTSACKYVDTHTDRTPARRKKKHKKMPDRETKCRKRDSCSSGADESSNSNSSSGRGSSNNSNKLERTTFWATNTRTLTHTHRVTLMHSHWSEGVSEPAHASEKICFELS